jgi:DMSO/TMAO reductase YedYZ molybdopterin-dependent catalytic subunit
MITVTASPVFRAGRALVAWEIDGKPVSPEEAPFRLVVTTDKEPARSIYKLVRLEVVDLRAR